MRIEGGCHCGNIGYVLDLPGDDPEVAVRTCSCSFCTIHGGSYISYREASLHAVVKEPSHLSRYRFGTKTADFLVCSRCAAVPFVTSLIDGTLYAVVSVNSFRDLGRWTLHTTATSFDGETTEGRLESRAQTWIPDVTVREGAT